MSDKVKERIEKEADEYIKKSRWMESYKTTESKLAYIAGAESERPKAWNDALDAAIYDFDMVGGSWSASQIIERLEKLKHKHP